MGKLTATKVAALKEQGRYGDGDGLFLLVGRTGSRSWMVRVQKDGRRRDIGLGSAKKVTLAQARERAALVRSQLDAGHDPVAERKRAAGIPTFSEAAERVHRENKAGWRNPKHRAQWLSTLQAYAFPTFGDKRVNEIDGPMVRDALLEIWLTKPETARRLKQRIVTVIDWAIGKGYRDMPLPLAAIAKALPRQRAKVQHHAAMPYAEVPAFLATLRKRESMGRLALELAVLTAARSGEIRGAKWEEFDLEGAIWTIPADRMKAGREHVVPLSSAALHVLHRAAALKVSDSEHVFHGANAHKPLSDMTLTKVLRDMELDVTVHGFRSSFRDWTSEETSFPGDVAEAALAHTIENKTEAAYRRGNLLDKRRKLMAAWADYCDGKDANVVQLAARA